MMATEDNTTTKQDSALRWAREGARIFQIKANAKTPAHDGWQEEATTDEATIAGWFQKNNRLNYALLMGDQLPDGRYLLAVDVDMHLGPDGILAKNGEKSFLKMCQDAGLDPAALVKTRMQHTPSGQRENGKNEGGHLLFTTSMRLKGGTDKLGPGVDVKAAGGYILGAGSTIAGKEYQLADWEAPILPLPEVIEALLEAAPAEKERGKAALPGIDSDRASERALAYLKDHAPLSVEGQGGDQTAFKVAAALKDYGCTEAQTLMLLWEDWNPRCSPPWDPEDLTEKVRNAFVYGSEAPGSAAPEAVFTQVEPSAAEPSPKPKRPAALEVLRWSDFKDLHVPPVRWIWDPFFPVVPFGVMASHPGHGKSLLSLQIAVSVATGLPLFGAPTCGPAGAGVLALEDDQNVIHRRLKAIREDYAMAWTSHHDELLDLNLRVMVRGRTPLEGMEGTAAAHHLAQLAKELGTAMATTQDPPAVLFLDTLNAVHGGDENSNTEARPLVAAIFGLHDALNCSVWALHHLRKAGSGRNAPAMTDRLDPELVRGAGALVGSARAVVQFGWITPTEAGKAGLEPENSQRLYAVLGLTKVNDGPLSQWMLLEHTKRAGLWTPTPDGEKALAILRGGNAAEKLGKAEEILLDLHSGAGRGDRKELIARHYPDDPKGSDKLKTALQDLRRRRGWLQTGSLELTAQGLKKVMELKGRQPAEACLLEESENEQGIDFG